MIGDGVNDVLALKQADLAITPQGGSQAARAVADIILMEIRSRCCPRWCRKASVF